MSIGQKLIKGSMFRIVNLFLQLAAAFIMMPFVIHSLGDKLYGFWILVGTFMGYYGLLDLGLSSAVERYVSRALGKNDIRDINNIINTSFVLLSILGTFVLGISFSVAVFCSYFIKSPEELDLFRKVIVILGINIAIGFPIRVFTGVITSHLRYDISSYISITRLILANLFIYYTLKKGYGILALTLITFFASLLEYTLIVYFTKRIFPQLHINRNLYQKERARELFSYSKKTFIAQLADILRFRIDVIVITYFINLSLVTYYSVGIKLLEYFTVFIISSVGIMAPVFSQYEGRGDFNLIRKRFLDVTKISVMLSVFVGASIIYYGEVFIVRWMGSGFESSYFVILILCIPLIIALMQNPSIGLLYGISHHKYYAVSNICEGILNLTLSIILVNYYGIYGVALGTAISMMIFKLFIQPVYVCHVINLSVFEYYVKTLLLTVLKTLVPILLYFYLVKDYLDANYISIVINGGIQLILLVPIIFFFIFGEKERQMIKDAVTR
jgi:O-antigen/teichoic acid export membrane protein